MNLFMRNAASVSSFTYVFTIISGFCASIWFLNVICKFSNRMCGQYGHFTRLRYIQISKSDYVIHFVNCSLLLYSSQLFTYYPKNNEIVNCKLQLVIKQYKIRNEIRKSLFLMTRWWFQRWIKHLHIISLK